MLSGKTSGHMHIKKRQAGLKRFDKPRLSDVVSAGPLIEFCCSSLLNFHWIIHRTFDFDFIAKGIMDIERVPPRGRTSGSGNQSGNMQHRDVDERYR